MKDQSIRVFRTTPEVMTNHYDYNVIPGRFRGCVDSNLSPEI